MNKSIIFSLYARVSSDKHAKDKTIDSQIAALRKKIAADDGNRPALNIGNWTKDRAH